MKIIKVNISDFSSSMGYCQFGVINKFHLGLKKQLSPEMKRGKKIHTILELEDALIPRQEATESQLQTHSFDLDFAREGITLSISRTNPSTEDRFIYIGRTDKVFRKNGNIYILDDRISSMPVGADYVPYPDKILQLAAYCEAFKINYGHMIKYNKIFFEVVKRDSGGKVLARFTKEYDQEARDILMENLRTFEAIYRKELQPEHHNNPNKCKACGFFSQCKNKINA